MIPLLTALFFGFIPCFFFAAILYWLDRYEKEPKLLLIGVFLWGAIVAAGGSYILNSLFGITVFGLTGSDSLASVAGATLSAPFVEETLKGMAVLIVFLVFRHEFDSILDGIVYAGIAALGFAAVENSIYIWRGYLSDGWGGLATLVFIRVIMVGWQHPFYTSFIGMGLAIARTNNNGFIKVVAPLAGWGLAMFTHSMHNFLASVPLFGDLTCLLISVLDWIGVFFMFAVILWAGWMEHRNIINHMREEVQLGVITPAQYSTASSNIALSIVWLTSIFSGKFRATSRFYQVIGELAHKKEQLRKHGEEGGNSALVQKYRTELAALSPRAQD
ncbi:MAG: PrsW family intramembrane metalloprotease [Anaerolineales bacterium]